MDDNRDFFKKILSSTGIKPKDNYTSVEISQYCNKLKNNDNGNIINSTLLIKNLCDVWNICDKTGLKNIIQLINEKIKTIEGNDNCLIKKINSSGMKKNELREELIKFINICYIHINNNNSTIVLEYISLTYLKKSIYLTSIKDNNEIIKINENFSKINKYINNVKNVLDESIYGQEKAKQQLEIIIGQWINGTQEGYCFGFEGPPGCGKTSLSKKGLSLCLKDDEGVSRPFSMIQMGGDSNGSTLNGHNYTYVGSTWGSIVQILMDTKCMNPIIFIDEVDKISKTEHGKEIIGILTHLLDPTQNDVFQDKYYSGINLDLSKALFILSYNDPDSIDRILLDRIHRIKFESLSTEDKLIIVKNHILPEVYKKFGLENIFIFKDETIKFIIENYTCEAGVRKLKEKLYEIIGELNLSLLKDSLLINDNVYPLEITISDIKNKYFKNKQEIKLKKIHEESCVGIINCLWANTLGQGGILPTIGKFIPTENFLDLKLTGLLDEMMKESIYVSLTLAWSLTNNLVQDTVRDLYEKKYKYGIHLHAGDGSINKSGTSAGIAISILIYSLLNNRKINNTFGVTGEANLDGSVNEIGALNHKFIGGIKAGIKSFIFPKENLKDYNDFIIKYKDNPIIEGINFYPISNIQEAFDLIFI